MLKVYCDAGGYRPELKEFERAGLVSLCNYPYENRNRKVSTRVPSSKPTWEEGDSTWETDGGGTWNDYEDQSSKWPEILSLIGSSNLRDAKHLDSAFKGGCQAFLTSDLRDLGSKSTEIHALLGIQVFHAQRGWNSFVLLVKGGA